MQILKLKTLTRQGEPDPNEDLSIVITPEIYNSLPIMDDESFSSCNIEKGKFHEIYRNHSKDINSTHTALIIEYPDTEQLPWYIVWVENESLWIAFKYKNIIDPEEAYGSTVEVVEPIRSDVYKINDYVAELLRQMYKINAPLNKVYCAEPSSF